MASKPEKVSLTRNQAFFAKPLAAEIRRRQPLPNGGQRVTVAVPTSGLRKRILRLPDRVSRDYVLDAFGVEVLEMCDGKTTVRQIIKRFARQHQLNEHEAERAVVEFLRMLMNKGVVSLIVKS